MEDVTAVTSRPRTPPSTSPAAAAHGAGGDGAAARGVTGMRVNSAAAPLGTQTAPVFSWIPRVDRQSAYEIEGGTAPGRADVWRSGRVSGAAGTAVPYGGGELASRRAYFWRGRGGSAAACRRTTTGGT